MAAEVLEVIHIPDGALPDAGGGDDDEISVVYATTFPPKRGATKSDAISVEDYRPKPKTHHADDDDLKILYFFPKSRKRVFTGECSRSKTGNNDAAHQFLCEICADEKPNREKFSILGCDHSYCSDCVRKYVASKLQNNVVSIGCPVSGCRGTLEPQHCRSILPDQVFDRWGEALCEAVILASEKFYCPFKDCSALLVDDSCGGNGVMAESECPNCNRLFCVQCKVPWHFGISCDDFRKLRADERGSEDIMLVNLAKNMRWMRCPKCRFYVEKSEGCLFMKCRCGHGFCYNCGAPLKEHYCRQCKH
ncbi:RING/U-box superfamily protein [Striga hermonthica]|uniref:RBR-type E3 ubiquitin transferase n=1 Tax=Striga hermonthica TaxID=68872 RepID=A0A9N7RME7_STRHE|nr:RING/U-box superfamily protein [Striga hermonthica]